MAVTLKNEEPNEEPFILTPKHGILLFGSKPYGSKYGVNIGLYHLYKASAAQLNRLNYSDKSVKLTKSKLALLAYHDFVQFDMTPTRQYRSPYYYVLGNRGVEEARSLGLTVSDSYRPSKEIGQNYLHLLHHLGVNDVLISAAILKRQAPAYNLEHFILERDLAHEPFTTSWHGKQYGIVPDLFLDMRQALSDGRQRRTPVVIEHDRGTESEEVIRRKIHAYSAMIASGWYKTRYGVNSITIAFTTFEGERRRDKLRAWTKQELHGENRSLLSSFLFTTQPQPPDPQHIWLGRCWYTPDSDQPISLLAEEEAHNAHA